jgi:hypothetical protein
VDKLEIKQGSFIQQTQYFIPVEIDLSVVPARLGISVPSDNRNTRSTINNQNIDNSECLGVTFVKIYPEMTS